MRRARTIIGLPIISLAEGVRVGEVKDLVFDPNGRKIAALVVSEASWRHDAEIIPMEKVHSFGRDAVTILALDGLIRARTDRDLNRLLTSDIKLDGLLVMTEGGNYLGILEEIIVGSQGEMIAYEISTSFAEDVQHGKYHLPANEALTVGRDVATFPDGIERLMTHQISELTVPTNPTTAETPVSEVQVTTGGQANGATVH
jgi:uncharacterized protein YrrD